MIRILDISLNDDASYWILGGTDLNNRGLKVSESAPGECSFEEKQKSYEHKNVDKGLWAEVWINRIFSRWLLNIRP